MVIYTRGVGGAGELTGEICDILAEFETDVQTEEEAEIVSPELARIMLLAAEFALRISTFQSLHIT